MKKLKFMLAAATAIGLASALQASSPVADEPQFMGSTDFEDYSLGAVTAATDSVYFHLPDSAEEGDYQIVESAAPSVNRPNNLPSWFDRGRNQILQLEGGTDPLERYIAGNSLVDLTAGSVYVDTLVQFTVTPLGDTVTAQSGDKLMVYLQVSTNALGEASTNLMAKAGALSAGETVAGGKDYVLTVGSGTEINAGQWYRLTVKAIKDVSGGQGVLGFRVFVDGDECVANAAPFDPADASSEEVFGNASDDDYDDIVTYKTILISILGPQANADNLKLQSVGFAGSGLVDDLVFTTLDPEVTFLTFTLAWNANGTQAFDTAPTYTCGELSGEVAAAGTTVWCPSGTNVVVTYAFDGDAYNYAWDNIDLVCDGSDEFTPVAGTTYTLSATGATSLEFTFAFTGDHVNGVIYTVGEGMVVVTNKGETVPANSTLTVMGFVLDPWYVVASDSAVTNGSEFVISADNMSFAVTAVAASSDDLPDTATLADVGVDAATTGLDDADLQNVAKWANTYAGGGVGSVATVNEMRFDANGVPLNMTSEAYLLNTNATAEAVAQAKAEFAFTSFDPANPPTAADFDSKGYNGTVTIQGKETLSAASWTDLPIFGIYPKFFRAILTKPVPTP